MKIFLTIFIVAIVLLGGAVALFGGRLSEKLPSFSAGPAGTAVWIEQADVRDLVETVSAPGEIEAHTKVEISSRVNSEIVALPFREGETVAVSDVVVRLDDRDLKARLEGAQAALDSANANLEATKAARERTSAQLQEQLARHAGLLSSLEFAQRNLERKQELYDSGDIPMSELDAARERVQDVQASIQASTTLISGAESSLAASDAQIVQAEAAVKQAAAEIRFAEEALRNTIIRSPIAGKITKLNAEVGEAVVAGAMNQPGFVIMSIADLSRMKMIARIAESDIAAVEEGQTARIHFLAYPDEVFGGVVDRISLQRTQAPDGTGYFEAEIMLRLEGRELRSGLQANTDIEIRTHDGVVVPSQCVVDRNIEDLPQEIAAAAPAGKKTVRVVYRVVDGKAVATPVEVGPSDLTHRVITSGLSEVDRVITGPYKVLDTLKHGQAVVDLAQQNTATETPASP